LETSPARSRLRPKILAFSGNFGNVTIDKFVAGGTTHDVISFASND
jgi:hypothetical protein